MMRKRKPSKPRGMRQKIAAVLLSALFGTGMALVPAAEAQASPGFVSIQVTCQSWSPIYNQFHQSWGGFTSRNVGACVVDGELNGNTSYEPRQFYVGPHWCVSWWYKVSGYAAGPVNYTQGGNTGAWQNIYLGDGYPNSYRVYMESWYGSWCP